MWCAASVPCGPLQSPLGVISGGPVVVAVVAVVAGMVCCAVEGPVDPQFVPPLTPGVVYFWPGALKLWVLSNPML